jgi:hypothetical protein
MRPRDLPAAFLKATKTYWPGRRQPARAEAQRAAIEESFERPDSYRDLTEAELKHIQDTDTCPYCGAGTLLGPEAGMCVNLLCSNVECRARFNVAVMGPGTLLTGQYTMRETRETYDGISRI